VSGRTTNSDERRCANGVRARSCKRLARIALAALLLEAAAAFAGAQENAPLDLLTNAQQVLDLGIDGARRAPHPVRLQAVVTYPVIRRPLFYAQDATAGILVVCTNQSHLPSAGQLVEVVGRAGPGLQAPHVYASNYSVIGTGPLPAPRPADPARLVIGEEFGQWVSVEGNVLDYLLHPDQLSLLLQEGDHHFVVNISLTGPITMPPGWLGGRIEAEGVCWTEARADGMPVSFRIHTPGTNTITILRGGPTNLFALPLRTVSSLASQPGARDRRVRIVGSVTLFLPEQSLFLRDDTGAIQVRLLQPISATTYLESVNADTLFRNLAPNISWGSFARPRPYIVPVEPGDRVEVVGTPSASGLGLVLSEAEYRRLGPGVAPVPVKVSAEDLIETLHEGDLVTWRGRLIDRQTHQSSEAVEDLLVLRDGTATVRALFTGQRGRGLPELPQNAFLQLTGVCSSEPGESKVMRSFRLLLRSPSDVSVLAQPPPWESWRVGRILLVGSALGIGALAWIGFLRHRVARRTAELALSNTRLLAEVEERKRAQAEVSRALTAEKELSQLKNRFVSMVSHEFRTPLGVILASADLLSDYLETLTPEERSEQLTDIKQSTRHMAALMEDVLLLGRVESGRMGYHPQDFDLADFCRRLTDEILSATSRRCPIELSEQGIDLTARGDETLLRHVFHNLLANGVKYSAPGQPVRFSVKRAGDDAVFTVCDQGIGISVEDQKHVFEAFYRGKNVGDRPGSGLGLVVVKRCVELHGGVIDLHSRPGEGTTITVRVPLYRAAGHTDLVHRASVTPIPQPI
jgi:signal transduction histidine kinase